MKKLLTYFSKRSLSLENESRMDRHWIGIDSTISRKLCALLFCLLMGFGQMWAGISVLSFTSSSATPTSGTSYNDDQSNSWTINHDSQYKVIDGDAIHVGSSSKTASYLKATSSSFSGVTVTSVVVNAKQNGTGSVDVKINNSAFGGDPQTLTNSYDDYTFTGSVAVTGNIVVNLSRASATKKNFFLKTLTVTYLTAITLDKNGGSENGSVKYDHDASSYATSSFTAVARDGYTCTGYWTASSGGTKILNANGTLAGASITVNTVPYTSSSTKWAYAGKALTLYAQWESAGTSVSLSQAATTNGSFKLSSSNTGTPEINSVSTAGGSGTVYVVGTPSTGYYVSNVTQSGASVAPTITEESENVWSVVYGSSTTGTSTISVTFSPIWALKGDFDSWGDGYVMTGTGTVSVTRTLTANTRYEFKIYNKATAYGNNGAIVGPMSGWVMSSAGGVGNCRIHTANAGEYTFSLNTSTKELTVTYPSVTHPSEYYVYFKNSDVWGTVYGFMTGGSGDFAGWPGTVTNTTTICGETYHYAALLDNGSVYNKIIFNNGGSGYGNQTSDLTMPGVGKYNANRDANWHTFDKYTISYDKGTGTDGSMSSHTGLCPGSNQALSANAFTKDHYHFTGWIADRDVTINSATVTQGTLITGTPTIENVQSNITLTAQWEVNSNTLTWNWGGGSTTSTSYTLYPATSGSVNYGTTITYPANGTMSKTGYNFSSWSSSATSMPDEALTITASWTPQEYSITYKDQGGGDFSGTQTTPPTTHTYGTSTTLKIPTKAGYIFGGWYTSSDCSTGAVGTASAASLGATDYTANIILYAKWTDKGCTDHNGDNVVSGSTGSAYYGPVSTYYKYSTKQILYTKTDLGLAAGKKGTIKSIYFNAATDITARKITIYMANSSLDALSTSNYVPYSNFTQVFTSNSWSCSTGWNEIDLDTDFEYNGVGSLVVLIDDNTGVYKTSETFNCHTATTTTGAQIYTGSDSDNADPSTTTWSTYTATNNRPNTKFCIQESDMVQYTVTWHVGENTSTSTVYSGTAFSDLDPENDAPAHGDNALAACNSTKFIGWVKAAGAFAEDGKTVDWYNTYKYSPSDQINGDVDIYAMYAEGSSTSKTMEFTISPSDFNSTSYAANNNEKTTTATATDASGTTMSVKWTSNQIMLNSSNMQWQKNTGYIYNSTDLGTVNSVTITKTAGTYSTAYGTSSQPASGSAGTGKGFFKTTINNTETGYTSSYVVNFTTTVTTYTNYRTGCSVSCGAPDLAVASSITAYGATISWTDAGKAGTLDHYEYAVWKDGDNEPTSGYTSTGTTKNATLSGLLSNTTYRYKVRRVCSGDDNSRFSTSSFTTSYVALTFNVPTGASAVAGQNSNVDLPEADVPTDCGSCWAFVGWTTAAYAASSAPAKLFPADAPVHLAYEDGTALHAVYKKDEFAMIQTLEGLTENSYYVLTKVMDGGTYDDHEFAMTGAAVGNDLDGYDLTVNGYLPVYGGIFYVINPPVNAIWKFTGTAASGSFYNESVEKYLDLSSTSNPIVQAETDKHLTFTVIDGGEGYVDAFKLTDATTTTNMLYWGATDGDYGVTTESETNSGFLYKRTSCAYTTAPDCPKYEVKWDINNGATTTTDYVTKCDAYLEDLPDNPANTVLDGCIGSGKGRFMGWSPTKVMPAQNAVPTGMFNDVEDAPEITDNVTFYAVFAEEKTGSVAATSKTYTFTSSSWGDDASAWTSGAEGYALVSGRGIQVTSGKSGANATTKSSYDDVTKVTVTYSTNASSGAGSIDIKVNGTSYTGSASVTNTGGTSDRTIDFTPPSSALDGAVKITVSCSTSSVYIKSVQIFYTGSTTTYEGYRTACCDDADLTFGTQASPVTQYTIVREDLASASAGVEIDCNFESNNTSEDITWSQTKRIKTDYHTAQTWNDAQPASGQCVIDVENKKISANETGSWQITIAQAMGSTNYCDETATVNVLVKTIDKFVDAVNGNFSGEAQRLEDTGNGITLPTEATFSTNNGCADGKTRRLIGWIKASDLATYASGRRVDMIDDLKTGDGDNKVIAPGTKVQATGVTWYAVWGVEK